MVKDLLLRTDLELVEEARLGNRRAFSELVKRHQRGLLRLSLRFVRDLDVAEDVVQESFIKAFEKLNTFEGRASFKSWLFQIGVNTARNKIRERKRVTTEIDQMQIAVGAEAENGLVHSAISEAIQEEVQKLPFKQRTALVLRVYEDLSFQEISEVMQCPYDTAKANYRHALLKLKDVFGKKEELKTWAYEVGGFLTEYQQNYMEVEG